MKKYFIALLLAALVVAGVLLWIKSQLISSRSIKQNEVEQSTHLRSAQRSEVVSKGAMPGVTNQNGTLTKSVKSLDGFTLEEAKTMHPDLSEEYIRKYIEQGLRVSRIESVPLGRMSVFGVTVAFQGYREMYGVFPKGSSVEIAKQLKGGNSKGIVFLDDYKGKFTNKAGELVDPWNNPLVIEFKDGDTTVRVLSVGPDGIPETKDDIELK